MALMNISIISTALYTISVDFNDYRRTIWAALAYTLADIACAVFVTRLSDVLGRKTMILISFFIFTCFSLASGFAQTADQLIIFRTLQGIGGTGLYALTIVVCPQISPAKLRPLVITIISVTTACAGICGPVLGGIITGKTTWRWIFWLNVPIGGMAMIILFFAFPSAKEMPRIGKPLHLKQLDFLGAFLNAAASVSFVICLQEAGTRQFQWKSGIIISLFTISGAAVVLFCAWQWFISSGKISQWILPQLPFRIMKHRAMSISIVSTVLTGYVYFTAIFTIPIRYQVVDLNSPVRAGVRLLPLVASTAFGTLASGVVATRRPKKNISFWTMSIATALMSIGTGLLSDLPSDGARTKSQYGWEVILGLGVGMSFSTATFATMIEAELLDNAVAQGTIAQSRILGGAIGIAASTITMNNHLQSAFERVLSPDSLQTLFISPFSIRSYGIAVESLFRETFIAIFAADMRIAMYVSIAAFVASLCAWQKNPRTIHQKIELLEAAREKYALEREETTS
ncbi:major facilitator superfamily transporter [Stipitochalara longipes BDJ]|nr:major facilitator superfamily transporter [Stipitochalara longipes BDJ]